MAERIVEISLTLDEEYMQSSSTYGGRIRMMGAPDSSYVLDLGYSGSYDAQIVEASGLEMPEIVVFGGDLYGGGSKFTGTRLADREIDLTLVPMDGGTPSDIKSKLSALVGMSNRKALTMRVTTEAYDFVAKDDADWNHPPEQSVWMSEVYISNITSPVFSDSSEINVTLSMGDVAFEGAQQIQRPLSKDPVSVVSKFTDVTPSRRLVYPPLHLTSGDLEVLEAPSPLDVTVDVRTEGDRGSAKIRGVFVDDLSGGTIYISSGGREWNTPFSVQYQASRGELSAGGYSFTTDSLPARTSGKLPLARPSRESFRIGVEVDYTDVSKVNFNSGFAYLYPRRYGF